MGPRGLGSCVRQNEGSALRRRSSRSLPRSFMKAEIPATETKYTMDRMIALQKAPIPSKKAVHFL